MDQKGGLNYAAKWFSVSHFSLEFWKFVWPFERVLGRPNGLEPLHICLAMRINQYNEPLSLAMKFEISSLSPLKHLPFLSKFEFHA